MVETYSVDVKCRNCKRTNYVVGIKKGKAVEQHCLDDGINCNSCDCPLFVEEEEKPKKKDD